MSKPILEIWRGGEDPFDTVELDRESRKYIHVRIDFITKTYDPVTGEETRTDDYFEVSRCKEENFNDEF